MIWGTEAETGREKPQYSAKRKLNPNSEPALIHKNVLVKMVEKKIKNFFLGAPHTAKSLIFHELVACFAASQFVEVRMKSAFSHVKTQLHTKLSTEFVDSRKMPFATDI